MAMQLCSFWIWSFKWTIQFWFSIFLQNHSRVKAKGKKKIYKNCSNFRKTATAAQSANLLNDLSASSSWSFSRLLTTVASSHLLLRVKKLSEKTPPGALRYAGTDGRVRFHSFNLLREVCNSSRAGFGAHHPPALSNENKTLQVHLWRIKNRLL